MNRKSHIERHFSLISTMAIKPCICILLSLLSTSLTPAQQKVSGIVVDASSGHPLAAISVYLNNTSIGTTTNAKGEFTIGHVPPAIYKLIASGISFKTFSTMIDTRDSVPYMTIQLTRTADLLQGAQVKAPDPDGWTKWGRLFTNLFIGTSPPAGDCHLLNHEVLKFRMNDDNTLTVYAVKPLLLHNAALGYDISYDLEELDYDLSTAVVAYSGHVFFKDLSLAHTGGRATTWRRNRLEVYNGSILQFMRSLYTNTLQTQGFELHSLAKIPNREKQRVKRLLATKQKIDDSTNYYKTVLHQPDTIISYAPISADSVAFAADTTLAGFYFPDSLQVSYTLKEAPAAYKRLSRAVRRDPYPISQLVFVNKKPVYILSNGFYYNGGDLKMTGFWGWSETLGTLLPYDYEPR